MAKHFIFVDDYKIAPKWKVQRKNNIAIGLAALYVYKKMRNSKKGGGGGKGRNVYVPRAIKADTRQRCTVKMNYSKNIEAHKYQLEKYLIKEGKGKDGTTPQLYGSNLDEYKKNMVKKNIRIFLSPANNDIPLRSLAESFIKKIQAQIGYDLHWVGTEHYDTAHNHVHLLINGRDKNGNYVFLPPDLVKLYAREHARDICTSLIGPRTKEDIQKEREGTYTANRYTFIDRRIEEQMKNKLNFIPSGGPRYKRELLHRLDHLRDLELCRFDGAQYIFKKNWTDTLRANGRYNSYLEAQTQLKYTDRQNLKLYGEASGVVQGKISKIYMTDEQSNSHAILLEAIDGNAYFVPFFKKPKSSVGDHIKITPVKNQKGRLYPQIESQSVDEIFKKCKEKFLNSGYAKYISTTHTEKPQKERSEG